jgi:hypothetical protein
MKRKAGYVSIVLLCLHCGPSKRSVSIRCYGQAAIEDGRTLLTSLFQGVSFIFPHIDNDCRYAVNTKDRTLDNLCF